MNPRIYALGAASACAFHAAAEPPGPSAELPRAAASLRNQLVEQWPTRGSVHVVVRNPKAPSSEGLYYAGYNFANGAWYYIDTDAEKVLGTDTSGSTYSGKANIDGVSTVNEPHPEWKDSFLDSFFPGIYLRGALGRVDGLRSIQKVPTGWQLTFAFPRGLRDWRIEHLPAVDIERLGGAAAAHFEHRLLVDNNLLVTSFEDVHGGTKRAFDQASGSPPGFQVLTGAYSNMDGLILESVRWLPAGDEAAFEPKSVLDKAISDRVNRRPVRQFATNADGTPIGDRPIGVRGSATESPVLGSRAMFIAGAVLVTLGIAAWWRNRSARVHP